MAKPEPKCARCKDRGWVPRMKADPIARLITIYCPDCNKLEKPPSEEHNNG